MKNKPSGYLTPKLKRTLYTIAKLAYFSCSKDYYMNWYDEELDGLEYDVQICCLTLFSIIQKNNREADGYFDTELRKRNRYRSRENLCTYAALFGHIDCLKFANQNGCPMDEMTMTVAAQQGFMDCLVYAHENGCLWGLEGISRSYEVLSRPGCQFDECRKYVKSIMDEVLYK